MYSGNRRVGSVCTSHACLIRELCLDFLQLSRSVAQLKTGKGSAKIPPKTVFNWPTSILGSYSVPLVISEINPPKPSLRHHAPTRTARITITDNSKCGVEVHCWWENKMVPALENRWAILQDVYHRDPT